MMTANIAASKGAARSTRHAMMSAQATQVRISNSTWVVFAKGENCLANSTGFDKATPATAIRIFTPPSDRR